MVLVEGGGVEYLYARLLVGVWGSIEVDGGTPNPSHP